MARIAENEQKRLILIVVPQITTKMREKGKRDKRQVEKSKEKHTYIYPFVYIHPATETQHIKMQIHI